MDLKRIERFKAYIPPAYIYLSCEKDFLLQVEFTFNPLPTVTSGNQIDNFFLVR